MSDLLERFLRYVQIATASSTESGQSPSTACQHDLMRLLDRELRDMGLSDVRYDEAHCYVYASVPANNADLIPEGTRPYALGLIAHVDTSPDAPGEGVKPRVVTQYDGGDIVLNKEQNIVLSPKEFPELEKQKGNDLVVTDGTTLLGADDKAGVAQIMSFVRFLTEHPEVKHGDIRVAFTPDEEIGEGPKYFDVEGFKADGAYTIDGGKLGELEYECFNAAEGQVTINGKNVHPGTAKGKMVNANLIAMEFQSMLPVFMNPMYTEKREGFIHLNQMRGTVEKAVMHYILRDHDAKKLEKQKKLLRYVTEFLNLKYGEGCVELLIADVYRNMLEAITPHMHLVDNARQAMQDLGIEVYEDPIRGGTDGSQLSFKGLPCPNLCTGGYNFHGRFEYASVQEMEQCLEIIKGVSGLYAGVGVDEAGNPVNV